MITYADRVSEDTLWVAREYLIVRKGITPESAEALGYESPSQMAREHVRAVFIEQLNRGNPDLTSDMAAALALGLDIGYVELAGNRAEARRILDSLATTSVTDVETIENS